MGVLKLRNLLGIAAALVAAPLSLTPRVARAQDATAYSTTQRTFKVGILLVDSTTNPGNIPAGPENVDPYVFYIADQRKDVKPQGWDFSNPVAPKTVTTEVYNRWLARDVNNPYRIGEAVQKNMAAYWEVSLSKTPLSELVQFDALMLSTHSRLKFSLADREKLRKLVDAGGMLWLDDCGGMRVDPTGPFFLEGLQFQGSRPDTTGVAAGSGLPFVFQPEHPILNSPYALNIRQIALLGEYTDYRNRSLATLNPTGGASFQAPPNPAVLTNVVGNRAMGNLPYISVGSYGSGTLVATCGDTGCAINDYVGGNNAGYGGNSGSYLSNPKLERAHSEDLLFLYNLVQLGSSNTNFRRNIRRVGASGEDLRTPMTSVFNFTHPATPADAKVVSTSAPLVAHGRVYVAGLEPGGGAVTVRCYNAKPSYRHGDEGLPDLSLGRPYDEIWRTSIPNPSGTQPSSPVLATVLTGGLPLYEDCIFVTLGDGTVVKLLALPRDATGAALPNNIFAANPVELLGAPAQYDGIKDTAGNPGPAPAPIVYENRVYSVQPDGVVRCLDANTLGTLWKSVDAAPTDAITPTGSPTLGIVQLSDSTSTRNTRQTNLAARSNGNTNDVMLYVPVLNQTNLLGKVLPFWLGTRHEVMDLPLVPGSGNYGTRIYNGGTNTHWIANTVANPLGSFLRPVARVYDSVALLDSGTPSGTYTGTVTDAGLIEVRDAGGNPPPPGFPAVVSVDYDLLYNPGGAAPALGPPPGATSGGNGSRNPSGSTPNLQLDLPGFTQSGDYTGTSWGLDTPVLGPDDVLYSFVRQQAGQPSGGAPPTTMLTRSSLVGVREQYGSGATKLRHSFTVLERNPSTVVGGDPTAIRMSYTLPNGTSGRSSRRRRSLTRFSSPARPARRRRSRTATAMVRLTCIRSARPCCRAPTGFST